MKRSGHLYEKMISDENIRDAIIEVNKGHRWYSGHKPNPVTIWVDITIEDRIVELRNIIESGYVPNEYRVKKIYDHNAQKVRNICEPRLWPDQYVHHILVKILIPDMMRNMDHWCCGSIRQRGIKYGVDGLKKWMAEDKRGTGYCLEMDIKHFYDNIQPTEVIKRFRSLIKDPYVFNLMERVMSNGIVIGAYFSQWFANTLLQPLDRKIRELGAAHYLRYMDNFTVFSNRKRTLKKILAATKGWLAEHGLKLKSNFQIFRTSNRLPNALGFRYGRGYTLIRKSALLILTRQIRRYYKFKKMKRHITAKFAIGLMSRIGRLDMCNSTWIRKAFVKPGLIKELKTIIRNEHKRYETWENIISMAILS